MFFTGLKISNTSARSCGARGSSIHFAHWRLFSGLALPALALPLNPPERGPRLIDDLLHPRELNVVTEEDVKVIGAEPVQADIDAFGHAPRGEIEVLQIIAAQFGAEGETVPRHVAQGDAEKHFAHPAPVKWRGVDEVQPAIERDADATQRLVEA